MRLGVQCAAAQSVADADKWECCGPIQFGRGLETVATPGKHEEAGARGGDEFRLEVHPTQCLAPSLNCLFDRRAEREAAGGGEQQIARTASRVNDDQALAVWKMRLFKQAACKNGTGEEGTSVSSDREGDLLAQRSGGFAIEGRSALGQPFPPGHALASAKSKIAQLLAVGHKLAKC